MLKYYSDNSQKSNQFQIFTIPYYKETQAIQNLQELQTFSESEKFGF
jgi:hypothetical protein